MRSANVTWHQGSVERRQRWEALGRSGATIWLTGLHAAGKSTLAVALEAHLLEAGRPAYRLDGTTARQGVCSDLGYSGEDRRENNRRLAELARLFADAGTVAIVAAVSPFAAGREAGRALHENDGIPFIEVYVNTPLATCVERDPRGVYRRAAAGHSTGLPGIDQPYEPPTAAEVEVAPSTTTAQAVELVAAALHERVGAIAPRG
ncbi:adenylyl-sulfate kinase [Conexibacter stalactiti]|uniref:Adenylyl-sulfate kinase n=1 Tax=Conexibacter stalactiti TaxID=1940611 RepID=A0ABU4HW08_9ACTN|nr:adenylyl-sulfate kinase [Conexibacter stalactiti]MDW5597488.1 adenylyl-sulfate kinase [Conexibacter stalactiti]MEC5038130.1 adenylyl-sulfate kinase [Conexibacter stalactiti]